MIVPMKKVSLVVQDRYQQNALIKLRDIGVVHIQKTNAASDRLAKTLEQKAMAENALGLIQSYKAPKKKNQPEVRMDRRLSDHIGREENEPN